MTKQALIDEVSKREYHDICKKMLPALADDLYQELLLIILEYSEEKINRIENLNGARFFLIGILCNMVKSSRSTFYRKYRGTYQLSGDQVQVDDEYDFEKEKKLEVVEGALKDRYWFDKFVLESYVKHGSLAKTAKAEKISVAIIRQSLGNTKKIIKNKMKPIKILLMTQLEDNGLKYHRQLAPHVRLAKVNEEFHVTEKKGGRSEEGQVLESTIDDMSDDQLKQFDIVYYLRQISYRPDHVKATIDRIHKNGLKVVLDIDDYWNLNSGHHMYQIYKERNVAKETEEALRAVDHVITTTTYFADIIKEFNANVTVLPNCINPDDDQFKIRDIKTTDRVRFGWIGGVYHKADVEAIGSNFCKLAKDKQSSNKYQICLGGYSAQLTDRGMMPQPEYNAIENYMTCNYEFRNYDATYTNYLFTYTNTSEHISYDKPYRRLYGRSVFTYGDLYNEIDVSLVPLLPYKFNKCKSELKLVEAGTMGKAVIVSDTEPYSQWIKHGVNGIKVSPSRNNIDWYIEMRKLIKEPDKIKDLSLALSETVKEHFDIDKHNQTRAELYKHLAR